jgi:hypothetical protein
MTPVRRGNKHDDYCQHGRRLGEKCYHCIAGAGGEQGLAPDELECEARHLEYRDKVLAVVRPLVEKDWHGNEVLKAIEAVRW